MAGDDVTREDLTELYAKINQMAIDIAVIKNTMENWPKPDPRPCLYFLALQKEFSDHTNLHKEQAGNWKRAITSSLVHISEMGVIGLIMYWIAHALKSTGGPHLP